MDKRKARRIKSAARKAEQRVNRAIIIRVAELSRDKKLAEAIAAELDGLDTVDAINAYIGEAARISKDEVMNARRNNIAG